MYQELISLIELCLIDGKISDKERNVILNKSKSLNISDDECEIIIESLIHKHKTNSNHSEESKDVPSKSEISQKEMIYYTELQDLNNFQTIIERNNEKLKEVDILLPLLFEEWKKDNLKNLIVKINKPNIQSGDIDYLQSLMKKGGYFNSTIEYRIKDQIKKILDQDVFVVYVTFFKRIIFKEEHDYEHDCGLLFTDKGIYMLTSNLIGDKNVEFYSFEKPFVEISTGIFFNFRELIGTIEFFNDQRLKFTNEIKSSVIKLNTSKFMNVLSSSNIEEKDLKNLMTLINYKDRFINEHNSFIDSLKEVDLGIKQNRYNSDNLKNISDTFQYIIHTISHISTLLMYRDQLFYFYINGDKVRSYQLYNILDDIGVFQNKFQRDLIKNLYNINESLIKTNQSLINGFENITSSLNNISFNLNSISDGVSKINQKVDMSNFISMISTYQLYKINKNTKRIG